MSARIEQAVSKRAVAVRNEDNKPDVKVIGFDAERFHAPFTLRCGALAMDYLLLIIPPAISFLVAASSGDSGAKFFKNQAISLGWLLMLLIALTNLVVLPVVSGRTLGKFVTGLRVVKTNGHTLSLTATLIRHLIGYPLTILTLGIGFILAAFNRKGRALHDFLAGTIVVKANMRREVQISKKNRKRQERSQ